MLDSLFLSVADIALLTANADVGETVPMPMGRCQCQWSIRQIDC
jgi:hypothetical protein